MKYAYMIQKFELKRFNFQGKRSENLPLSRNCKGFLRLRMGLFPATVLIKTEWEGARDHTP